MTTSIQILSTHDDSQRRFEAGRAFKPIRARAIGGLLVAGCAVAGTLAGFITEPQLPLVEDLELARLLRGMAILKAVFVLAAIVGLLWRLRWPLSDRLAAGYLSGVWLATAASVQVWQLGALATASILFHAGLLIFLITALGDGRRRLGSARRADAPLVLLSPALPRSRDTGSSRSPSR